MHSRAATPWPAIPAAFCWTRIGDEGGQGIAAILLRKELERQATGGLFVWGIGNSVAKAVRELAALGGVPLAVFSPMRTNAAAIDRSPSGVVRWTAYVDERGEARPLPPGILVTSRSETPAGAVKTWHHALFCATDVPLDVRGASQTLRFADLQNFTTGRPVGFSQVTAVVARCPRRHDDDGGSITYDVSFIARLVPPFCARLVDPVPLAATDLLTIEDVARSRDVERWMRVAADLRARHPESGVHREEHADGLNARGLRSWKLYADTVADAAAALHESERPSRGSLA